MSSTENESSANEHSENEEDKIHLPDAKSDASSLENDYSTSEDSEATESDDTKPKLADEDFRQMPFEDLLQLKRRLGSKVYNEAVFGKTNDNKHLPVAEVKAKKGEHKRKVLKAHDSDSDGPPEELSAKRKVPALGMEKTRKQEQSQARDPRFDAKQGYFSGRKFREQYGFINDLRSDELSKLQKQLERTEDPDESARLKFAIQRTGNQIREFNKHREQDTKRMSEKLEAHKAVEEGKRPFYEKKSTKQAREMVEKYDKLKEAGKLDKHIDKRRKKITAKDRKKLDFET